MKETLRLLGRLLKTLVVGLLFIWLVIVLLGGKIDEICVEGKFSAVQAEAVNSLPWGKCPGYRDGNCQVEEGDRMLARECSELSRSFFLRNLW